MPRPANTAKVQGSLQEKPGWWEGFQAGERGVFARLLRERQGRLLRIAMRLLGNRDEALDVLQEASLKLYEHRGQLEWERGLDGWLYRVTVHECYRLLRRRGQQEELAGQPPPPAGQAPPPPEAEVASQEFLGVLQESLERLAPQERAAFVLRDLEGMEGAVVAEALGCQLTTARGYYFAARQKLSRFFRQRHPEWLESIGLR